MYWLELGLIMFVFFLLIELDNALTKVNRPISMRWNSVFPSTSLKTNNKRGIALRSLHSVFKDHPKKKSLVEFRTSTWRDFSAAEITSRRPIDLNNMIPHLADVVNS